MNSSHDKKIYLKLTALSKDKSNWDKEIPKVAEFLHHPSINIKAKTLWMLGGMGYKNPTIILPYVPEIAKTLQDENDKIRERTLNALGRIGRGNLSAVLPYLSEMLNMACDKNSDVRMSMIWACENIATNNPQVFELSMDIFSVLLEDSALRVRREAPEIFRVIGKRVPGYVMPYIDKLKYISENDVDRVVRAHSLGAIRITLNNAGQNLW